MAEPLNLSSLKPAQNRKDRKRIGRGKGRYSGRGIKGQKSRAGSHKMRAGFEGGQMPIYMRMGKQRGSTSKDAMPIGPFRTFTAPVNVGSLDRFDDGAEVTPESLVERGLLKNTKTDVKLLGNGELKKKLPCGCTRSPPPRARRSRLQGERCRCSGSRSRRREGRPGRRPQPRSRKKPPRLPRSNRCSPGLPTRGACRSCGSGSCSPS